MVVKHIKVILSAALHVEASVGDVRMLGLLRLGLWRLGLSASGLPVRALEILG